MDIEGTEWKILEELGSQGRLAGVRQLAIEVHTSKIIKSPPDKVQHTHTHTQNSLN